MRHHRKTATSGRIWIWITAFATAALLIFAGRIANAEDGSRSEDEIKILAFGDSLTAGYQIPQDKSFPAQLQAALRAKGYPVRVVNSGVSGDTASDGLARLDWSLSEKVDAAIIEFGGNDALRGINPKITEEAIGQILAKLKAQGVELLLVGMEAPRNWGADYSNGFRAIYQSLAQRYGALLYPFFLKDVAMVRALILPDGIHPTPEGVAVIVQNILPDAERLIARVKEKRAIGPR